MDRAKGCTQRDSNGDSVYDETSVLISPSKGAVEDVLHHRHGSVWVQERHFCSLAIQKYNKNNASIKHLCPLSLFVYFQIQCEINV